LAGQTKGDGENCMSNVINIKIPDLNSSRNECPLKGYEYDIMYRFKKDNALLGYSLSCMRIEVKLKVNLSNPSLKEAIESLEKYGYVTIEYKADGKNLVLTEKGYKKILEL
jgi:DNA-binding MarR family transcriptional regulator